MRPSLHDSEIPMHYWKKKALKNYSLLYIQFRLGVIGGDVIWKVSLWAWGILFFLPSLIHMEWARGPPMCEHDTDYARANVTQHSFAVGFNPSLQNHLVSLPPQVGQLPKGRFPEVEPFSSSWGELILPLNAHPCPNSILLPCFDSSLAIIQKSRISRFTYPATLRFAITIFVHMHFKISINQIKNTYKYF